jgi:hypothetical protein
VSKAASLEPFVDSEAWLSIECACPQQKETNMSDQSAVLPLTLQVPWSTQMELGMGYDYLGQALLTPAVSATDVNRSSVSEDRLEYKYVTSQEDLNQMIEASAQGSGSIEGVQVKASLEFSKSVHFSETCETLVVSWYSDSARFDRFKAPKLEASALALSKSKPDDFRLRYGDYFISGGLQRAEFHAVYQMSANKKEDLLKFKASAGASAKDLFSAEGSASFTQQAKANGVDISATIYQTASKSVAQKITPSLTPAQVLNMFTAFRVNHQDSWAVAELTHYSALVPNLSRAVPVPPAFFVDRALLLAARMTYQGILDTPAMLPREAAESLQRRRTALDTNVKASGALYWQRPNDLTTDREAAEKLAADVRGAAEFLHRVRILGGSGGGYSNIQPREGGEAGIGTHGDQTRVPEGVNVKEDTFAVADEWKSGNLTKHAEKQYPGCTIIYFKVQNNWPKDEGGTFSTTGAGGIGTSTVYFGFTADFSRGLSWSCTVKYIESAPVG